MKYSNGLVLSAIAISFLSTGCVKKPANEQAVVYDNSQPVVYEDAAPIVYEDASTVNQSGVIYSDIPVDNTVVTTTDVYGQPSTNVDYGQPTANGAYGQPNATSYPDPYANQPAATSYPDPYVGQPGSYPTSASNTGGIQLQIAALKDYYAAEEFKKSLSLDPKYSVYVKRGSVNKVIIRGISSVSEANQLKERRFPGSFIVHGSSAGSYTPPYDNNTYTTNDPYVNSAATGNSGVGVQIGAFSTKSKAQSAANSASSRYNGMVKRGKSHGKTIYKAILTGFSSESAARSFIANRGDGFIVRGL